MSAEMEVLDPRGKVVGAALSTRKADKTLAQGERVRLANEAGTVIFDIQEGARRVVEAISQFTATLER